MQDPVTDAGAYYAYQNFAPTSWGGGGTDLSPGERRQNELNDQRRIAINAGVTPEELAILTNDMSQGRLGQLTPEQLIARYRTVAGSHNDAFSNWWSRAAAEHDPAYYAAYNTFRSTFGRDPSSTEFAQLLPIYGGAEGIERGNAFVAKMFEDYKHTPEYLQTQAGNYSDELAPIFSDLLGRGATADEIKHYGSLLAGGNLDEYQLRQYLQQTPEYQTAQDTNFRSGLASELEGYDTSFFNKAKENVISRLAGNFNGAGTSSALDFALTDLMGQIAEKRGQYLAGLSASQYGGNKEAARADYEANRNKYFSDLDYTRRRNDANTDYYRNRADEDRDYQRQMNDYYDMLGRQNQGRNVLHGGDWINLGLGALNAGANAYSAFNRPYGNYSYLY